MQKFLYYFKRVCLVLQFLLLISAAVLLIFEFHRNPVELVVFLVMDALLILCDLYRVFTRSTRRYQSVILGVSLIDCALLMFFCHEVSFQIYYFFLLDLLFDLKNRKLEYLYMAFHTTGYFLSMGFYLFIVEQRAIFYGIENLLTLMATYGLVMLVFVIIHYFKSEQERLQILNADLIAYSFGEREYLIARERSEISQELHDSIGHSLMAVLMNIRFLKAIMPRENGKLTEQVNEIEKLLKGCVTSLRGSVSDLRKLDDNIRLKDEIEHIAHKFNALGFVKIELDFDDLADTAQKQIKSAIYKTIREGITNSIRHGNASKIMISIRCPKEQIELIIRDNGLGCADIHKSVGLCGILERVKDVKGKAWFTSQKNKGFTIRALLPGRFEG